MYKVDLHTHSAGSPDGGLRLRDYQRALQSKKLDYIAITDHDSITVAQEIQAVLGEHIIVGEEITTTEGEIIGLYLTKRVPPGRDMAATIAAIRKQGGLVYVPHPFETVRKGMSHQTLDAVAAEVDIVEVCNGRAVFQNKGRAASKCARAHGTAMAASSDAHGRRGWKRTYSILAQRPNRESLATLLKHAEGYKTRKVGLGILHPKLNRLKRRLRRG